MIGLLKYLSCFSSFKFIFYRTMGKGKCFFKLKKLENLRDHNNASSLHFLMQMRGLQTINTRKFGFIKWLDKGQITMKELESWSFKHQPFVRASEPTVKTSAFQIFHSGNSVFINLFHKTQFSCFTLPSMQHHSFFRG